MKDILKDKNIILSKYNDLVSLRNRISPDGDNTIYEEDHQAIDFALDLIEHLKLLGTKRHFKDSFELKVFIYEINEHFRNEDIDDRDFSDLVNEEIDTVIEEIEENGISYFKGYEITCDFDE